MDCISIVTYCVFAADDEDNMLYIIIGAAAGGGLLLLILIIICACCCCRRKRDDDAHLQEKSANGGVDGNTERLYQKNRNVKTFSNRFADLWRKKTLTPGNFPGEAVKG